MSVLLELKPFVQERVRRDFERADAYMIRLLFAHWVLSTFIMSLPYETYLLGFGAGGAIFVLAWGAFRFARRQSHFRIVAGVALMAYSALFIQQFYGRIEIHFHVFVALSFLTIYKDIRPMIAGAAFAVLHHLIFNYLQAYDVTFFGHEIIVFNYGCGLDIVLLHGIFVLFEAIVLYHIIKSKTEEFHHLIEVEHQIKNINYDLEQQVEERTIELVAAKNDAEQANALKTQFLANMSHEIRTPMNAVIGFADILQERETDALNLQYIDSIKRGAQALLKIINDILDISKIEAGRMDIEYGLVDLYALCEEVMMLFKQKAKAQNIELILDVDKNISKSLILDEVRLRQVLINLIGNGLKFTSKGYVKLSVSQKSSPVDRSYVDLDFTVEDSGMGIRSDSLERIFDSFVQQEGQQNKHFGGTGLGLSISKKLIEMMKGTIHVQSELGVGTTFTVHLYNVAIASIDVVSHQFVSIHETVFKPATVLLVDDIDVNRTLVKSFFKESAIVFIDATNGAEAVEAVKSHPIDLIIMDIKMEHLDGLEASRQIKAIKDIPIIILTASVQFEELVCDHCFESFLTKPVLKSTLLSEMARYLPVHAHEKRENPDARPLSTEQRALKERYVQLLEAVLKTGDMDRIEQEIANFAQETGRLPHERFDQLLERFRIAIEAFDLIYFRELIEELHQM